MSARPLSIPAPPRAPEFGAEALIACESLVRIYQSGPVEVQALQGLDLLVESGGMVAVVGASGSGKSTLLSILGGIDPPTAGRSRVASGTCCRCPAPTGSAIGGTPSASSGSRPPATWCRT